MVPYLHVKGVKSLQCGKTAIEKKKSVEAKESDKSGNPDFIPNKGISWVCLARNSVLNNP